MIYQGEHTLFQQIASGMIPAAFTSALLALVFFVFAFQNHNLQKAREYRILGEKCFKAHTFFIIGASLALFWALWQHYFEIDYVWKNSSKSMPLYYIFSAFWSGQQGSLLLWLFWQGVLGNFLIFKYSKNPLAFKSNFTLAMSFYSLIQAGLLVLILGIYLGDFRLGNNPFTLIRQLDENRDLPWTKMTSYLQEIPAFLDGQGLNPLLQNYWMTIHPPIIFLGFSLCIIPFVWVLSALYTRNLKNTFPVLIPYAFTAVGVLGLGIFLGGAWAYESLSFGGFWAWDPVENASLIPWLVLLSAAHLLLIAKNTSRHFFTAALLVLLSFVLGIYSTFLTRSGILGESSVHSFAGDGLLGPLLYLQLFFFFLTFDALLLNSNLQKKWRYAAFLHLLLFWILPEKINHFYTGGFLLFMSFLTWCVLVFRDQKSWATRQQEEPWYSREFWLLIGSLFVVLSALIVFFATSIPVWNRLFGTQFAPFNEISIRHAFYNPWIGFCFVIVLIALGFGQLFKYKFTPIKKRKISFYYGAAAIFVSLLSYVLFLKFEQKNALYLSLFAAACFAIFSQIHDFSKWWTKKQMGTAMAHLGFAIFLIGILIAMGLQKNISQNFSAVELGTLDPEFKNKKNILLRKNEAIPMSDYMVEYVQKYFSDSIHAYFKINYYQKKPTFYQENFEVIYEKKPYKALVSHIAKSIFEPDLWVEKKLEKEEDIYEIPLWQPYEKGDFLFELQPFVQKNQRFGNVAEPGTGRFFKGDVFTYLKYADFQDPSLDLLNLYPDRMSWRRLVYQPKTNLVIKQNDTIHWKEYIFFAGQLTPLSHEEKKQRNLDTLQTIAMLPLVISLQSNPTAQYPVYPLIFIQEKNKKNKENGIAFSEEKINDLGLKVQLDTRVFNEQQIALYIEDEKPLLYNGFSLKMQKISLIQDENEKKSLNFLASDEVYRLNFELSSSRDPLEKKHEIVLYYAIMQDGTPLPSILEIPHLDLELQIEGFGEQSEIVLLLRQKDFLVMEASFFPLMWLVFLGFSICFLGILTAVLQRVKMF